MGIFAYPLKIGTTIHETGHLIVAMIFGHTVTSYRPFAPDRKTGTLGSVETTFNPGNLYQYIGLFFIGIAPVVFGTLVIFVALYLLFREQLSDVSARMAIDASTVGSIPSQIITASLAFLSFLFRPDHLADWRLYVFLYIAFVIGSSISLSNADVKVATPGCTTFIALLFLFNLALVSIGVTSENTFAWLSQTYAFFYVILFLVIELDLLAVAILWIPAAIRRS